MTIHSSHPFATPPEQRDAARRLRGRLVAPVTLWASGTGPARVGLTVSSVLVALGEPARMLGLADPDSDLALGLGETFAVTLLAEGDHGLAEAFAGLAPAPGGLFRLAAFDDTAWGPVLAGRSWVGVRLESTRELGWSTEVVGVLEHVELTEQAPLVHLQGRYRGL
ncbi:flavin reductase [Propioniciclava sp. MC1683]|uniref:flavin reductase family protein n=1 Tax=Propioniciclava sp. MC1683 TaxID=2760309 RepID=UPI001600DA9A|nr:flavin reductase [Propioniciclava sp. MC1683]MBB1501532.1 flavin reductase [Propioniciclava sp. MC1683]